MNLEVNLVKIGSVDSKYGRLISRNRYLVQNDSEALASICKFIASNGSDFNAALTDKRLVSQLSDLRDITITDLDCLRYILSRKGLDIWYQYVADVEVNSEDIPEGMFEFNIVDSANMTSAFIPFTTKVLQNQSENKLTTLYEKITDMYGLFQGSIFKGMNNPITSMVEAMRSSEDLLGIIPTTQTTYTNAIFDFLRKEIRVITN